MADIISDIEKINDIEVSQEAPITEALFNKIGATINGLIDRVIDIQTFTANGNYTVPGEVGETVNLICFGYGGGSGGKDGNATGGAGGGGGAGAPYGWQFTTATAGDLLAVVIGSGGATNTAGGDTTFNSLTWRGADLDPAIGSDTRFGSRGIQSGGDGSPTLVGERGVASVTFAGGAGGVAGGGNGGGGGGGAGHGGAGAAGGAGNATVASAGASASANSGAGGGGGGLGNTSPNSGAGGSGGSGQLVIVSFN